MPPNPLPKRRTNYVPKGTKTPNNIFAFKKETATVVRAMIKQNALSAHIKAYKELRKRRLESLKNQKPSETISGIFGQSKTPKRKIGWGN